MSSGFEPFIDWDGLTEERIDDLHEGIVGFRKAQDRFIANKSKGAAMNVLRAQNDLSTTVTAIQQTLYTVPMMVHVAGECEEVDGQVFQRCKRCGSVLQLWAEGISQMTPDGPKPLGADDVSWWPSGWQIAKGKNGDGKTQMYSIRDRDLEEHELPCLDLTGLGTP